MTAVYLAERPVRSFPQIERPGPTLYAAERPRVSLLGFEAPQEHMYFAERPSSSLAFGILPPYLPDVAGLFDFDIQLSAVHSEIHIWGAAMPIGIQLSATAYPIEYATADFTTSLELEVGKLAEYPFAIELSASVKMVADAAMQQAINLTATSYPVEVQTGPLTLATALTATAYPVELRTALDDVALQLAASGYPVEIRPSAHALAIDLTASAYEWLPAITAAGMDRLTQANQVLAAASKWEQINGWQVSVAGTTIVTNGLIVVGSGNAYVEIGSSWNQSLNSNMDWRLKVNGVVVWTKGPASATSFNNTIASLALVQGDRLTVEGWGSSGSTARRTVMGNAGTYLRITPV